MSRMSEIYAMCMEIRVMMEDGSIDFDEAVEMLCEEFPVLNYEEANIFLLDMFEELQQ